MTQRLEDTCVPRLIGACHQRRLSGTLTLRQPQVVRHVYFEQGAVVYAASEVVTERFGERLCMLGCISPEQLAQAMLETKKGKRLGACLVELGYLTAADLQAMLTGHVTYLVHSLFPWTTGEYQFQPQKVHVDGFQQPLSPVSLIFDGIRNLPDLGLIRRWLGSPQRVLQPVVAGQVNVPGLTLTSEEAFVLSRLDAPFRVEDVCRAVPLPEEQVLRALCAFTMTGIVSFADPDPLPVIEANVKGAAASSAKASAGIDARQAAELCFDLEEKLRVVDGGGSHYQILGINRRFTPEELKKAYRELAKKFHPDRHSQLAAFDFQVKAELERVFIAVQQAYDVLSDEEKRRKYDLTLASHHSRSTPPGGRFSTGSYPAARPTPPSPPPVAGRSSPPAGNVPKPPVMPPRPPVPPARPAPTAEASRPPASSAAAPPKPPANSSFPTPPILQRPTVSAPASNTPGSGTPASTPTEAPSAKAPNSAPNSAPNVEAQCPPVPTPPAPPVSPNGTLPPTASPPQRLTGVYPKAPSRPAEPPIPASELYLRTVEYMGNGDVERAYQSIRRAVEQRPNNAEYHALMARVLLRMPGRNKEAEKSFLTAIDLCRDPDEVTELLMELSDLYLKFGLESRAVECLDRGLELSPEHEELKKRRQAIGAKQKTTPRLTGSLRVATGRRLQALVGKVFGLDDPEGDKSG
jgi:DnaJ-domain-containing protein 1